VQALCGLQLPSGHIHLLQHGVLPGLQVDICSTMELFGLQGDSLPDCVFFTGYRGISAPVPGAPPSPPSSLILVSAGWFLSHILTPLLAAMQCF